MNQATITVKYKDPPREGGKMWSISDGNLKLRVWPDDAQKYEIGGTYDVEYKTDQFNGRPVHKLTSGKKVGGSHGVENGGAEKGGIFHDIVPLLAAGKTVQQVVQILVQAHNAYEAYKVALSPANIEDTF